MGSDEDWEIATNALKSSRIKGIIIESMKEMELYGPKIDFHLQDC